MLFYRHFKLFFVYLLILSDVYAKMSLNKNLNETEIFMKVYGFCGASGTGKSYRALYVAGKYSIDYIIDDGILIHENRIIAGSSAKLEKTMIAAVKNAVFMNENERKKMADAISKLNISSVLILGTSEKMIKKIAKNLNLGNVEKIIKIEDIATKEEIELALNIRNTRGMHTVPLPTFAIKKEFSGMFVKSLNIFLKGKNSSENFECVKSVVRPTFSYFGEFHIKQNAVTAIAKHAAETAKKHIKCKKVNLTQHDDGIVIDLTISIKYGENLQNTASAIMKNVTEQVEYLTSLHTKKVNVYIRDLTYDKRSF